MPILTLKFKQDGAKIREYQLEPGRSLTIGRLESNDIVIENLAVSGHHAKIDSVGDGYLLTDLKSKNGTFVNDQLVLNHWLKAGDVITVGKHILLFSFAPDEPQPIEESGGSMNQTMVLDTGKYRSMLAQNVSTIASHAQKEPLGALSFLSGGEGEIELTKKLIKIGKNPASDIVIGGLMTGQTAATISKRPNGYYISFVGGMTKPKVNGESVKESLQLKPFDVIEIGSVKMQFIIKN